MKVEYLDPPRMFRAGTGRQIEIADSGRVYLEPGEQVTFVTPQGRQHDFVATSWGFYATPSVNGRLRDQGLKTAVVRNAAGRLYVLVVDRQRMADFQAYVQAEGLTVLEWLDERAAD